MKKILLVLPLLILSGCSFNIRNITSVIEINNNNCRIIKERDTHGGFLGDGEFYAEIRCKNINLEELSSNWKKMPLSKSLNDITEMVWCDYNKCGNLYEKYDIPNVNNGYYFFLDRHSDSKDKYDSTDLNNRSSYNFTLAMYDDESKIIYYYELDT